MLGWNQGEKERVTVTSWRYFLGLAGACVALLACSNDPYPARDAQKKILYSSFSSAPRTLDPAVAYSVVDHMVTGNVYDTLLEYHFLKRPYQLIPGLATEVPEAEILEDGRARYRFALREEILFQEDSCFTHFHPGTKTRQVTAQDMAFSLQRIADPKVNSPISSTLIRIMGFVEFGKRLQQMRDESEAFAALPVHEQYKEVGGIEGVRASGDLEVEIVLDSAYPQLLYWFAMPFTTPLPWEAVVYYDGNEGRNAFEEHPVGTGPFILSTYDKYARIVFDRNPNWYGALHPEWQAPGATYPSEGEAGDAEAGLLDPEYVGRPLPLIDRIEFRMEKENIPSFAKFLQGYYDASGVIQESYNMVVQEDQLSDEMMELGVDLVKSVSPDIYYLGFNMDDPVVGHEAGERGRKLRQAMSLMVDTEGYTERFANKRGIPAQSPLPPGLFGFDKEYRNPYRQVDLTLATRLMEEAGYPGGIDPATGKAIRLTFDTPDPSAQGRARYQFFVDAWRKLGVDVEIAATNYNQFQEKVGNGAYQLFMWGWVADYPDPENFFFLLHGPNGRTASGGPNTANFNHARYSELFLQMKDMPNSPERALLIDEMLKILEVERPWIELFHRENYALYHHWLANVKPVGLSFSTLKYRDLDAPLRARWREEHNHPIRWPLFLVVLGFAAMMVRGVQTYLEERQ